MQDPDTIQEHWEQPLLLEERSLPPWPQNVFPDVLNTFVNELSRFTETPIELSSMIALAVVATASHKKYHVQIKDGYIEPTNLWTMCILPPASRKSSVYKEVTSPLQKWEYQQKVLVEPSIRAAESNRKTMEVRLKALRMQAAKANEVDLIELQKQIESLENSMPDIKTCPQIWASDVTSEQLGVIMAANGDAMSVLNDEGGIFDIISGLYSDGRCNIDLMLQSHSGNATRVDRGSRASIFMDRAILTMGLTVQPHVLQKIIANKTFRGRGLLGRFLYALPKSNIGSRKLDEPPIAPDCVMNFHNSITFILNHATPEDAIATLYLDRDAFEKWLEYAKMIEQLMSNEIGVLSHITDWAGKLAGCVGRIAGLLHIFRYAHQSPWLHKISLQDMTAAVQIAHVLSYHALAVFDLLNEDSGMQLARAISDWIKERRCDSFTRRECSRKFRRCSKQELISSLNLLEEAAIIRSGQKIPITGRRSDTYQVNPLFLKNVSQ